MLFKKNDTVIFFGDSITDSNKSGVEGPYVWDALGNGYVNMVNSYYLLYHHDLNIRIINQGISGNRSQDLIDRFEKDVLSYNPNHVVLMIGVNDAWRTLDCPQIPVYNMTDDKYRSNVEYLVKTMLEKNINVVLMSPFYMEPNKMNVLRQMIDRYGLIVEDIAKKNKLLFINLQEAFDKLLEEVSIFTISGDRIHLNMAGNMFLRDQVLKHLNK
ncbi:MAG: SGNH/GDSL hydrolase family protein [Acholeplasma sp.]|nr:SGNH/GDSL hydrolase family protein [Acholeplasma sp.]